MATLLDFFKKIPCKKAEKNSPAAGDTPGKVKSNSPKENAKDFASEIGKKNGELDKKSFDSSTVLVNDECEHVASLASRDINRKRTFVADEDEESDNDEVTGRKVRVCFHNEHGHY